MHTVPSMVRRQLPEVARKHSISQAEFKNSLLNSLAPQMENSEMDGSPKKQYKLSQVLAAPRSRGESYDAFDPQLLN